MVLSWCHESTTRWSSSAQTWLNWRDDTEASLSAWLLNSASLHDVLPYTENITPHLTTKSNKPSTVGHLADVNTTICHKPVLYWVQINGLKLNAHKCWQWPCYNSYLWHYLTMTLPVLWHYLYCGIKAVACIAESFLNDKMTTAWRHTVLVFTATSRGATLDNNWTVATTHTDIHTSITSPQQSPCTQRLNYCIKYIHTHTYTHPFNGPLSGTTQVSRYQKGQTNLDFTEARNSEWQWHQLDHMQVCTSLETDNYASTPPLSFYRPDGLYDAQPTASKHWRQILYQTHTTDADLLTVSMVPNI